MITAPMTIPTMPCTCAESSHRRGAWGWGNRCFPHSCGSRGMDMLFRLMAEAGQPVGWLLVFGAAVIAAFTALTITAGLRSLFSTDLAVRKHALDVLKLLLEQFFSRRRK